MKTKMFCVLLLMVLLGFPSLRSSEGPPEVIVEEGGERDEPVGGEYKIFGWDKSEGKYRAIRSVTGLRRAWVREGKRIYFKEFDFGDLKLDGDDFLNKYELQKIEFIGFKNCKGLSFKNWPQNKIRKVELTDTAVRAEEDLVELFNPARFKRLIYFKFDNANYYSEGQEVKVDVEFVKDKSHEKYLPWFTEEVKKLSVDSDDYYQDVSRMSERTIYIEFEGRDVLRWKPVTEQEIRGESILGRMAKDLIAELKDIRFSDEGALLDPVPEQIAKPEKELEILPEGEAKRLTGEWLSGEEKVFSRPRLEGIVGSKFSDVSDVYASFEVPTEPSFCFKRWDFDKEADPLSDEKFVGVEKLVFKNCVNIDLKKKLGLVTFLHLENSAIKNLPDLLKHSGRFILVSKNSFMQTDAGWEKITYDVVEKVMLRSPGKSVTASIDDEAAYQYELIEDNLVRREDSRFGHEDFGIETDPEEAAETRVDTQTRWQRFVGFFARIWNKFPNIRGWLKSWFGRKTAAEEEVVEA